MVRAAATGGAGPSLLEGPHPPVERDRRHRTRPAFCQIVRGERKSADDPAAQHDPPGVAQHPEVLKFADQATVLLSYLASKDGMTKWTEGGVALPSRKDVPTPAGKDVLTKGSEYALPGSGFMPGYVDVQKAFQDAFTAQIQGKTFDAGPVVEATKAAIDKALAQ